MGLISECRYYTFGRFCIDTQNDTLLKDGLPVSITHKSFEILCYLAQNPDKIISKNDFFDIVWSESHVDETNLTQHIYRIRKIIESSDSKNVYIETIPKLGYRFVADVERINANQVKSNGNGKQTTNIHEITKEDLLDSSDNFHGSASVADEPLAIEPDRKFAPNRFASDVKIGRHRSKWSFFSKRLVLSFIFGVLLCFGAMRLFSETSFLSSTSATNDLKVAVLPFSQFGDPPNGNWGLGMADTIISKVSNLQGFSASPTETIAAYSKENANFRDTNLYEVGNDLNVDIVLTGSIQRENNIIRVNMRVYHVTEKRHICSIKFDEVDKGAFPLQDTISERIKQKFVADLKYHEKAKDGIKHQ